jgi:type III secretion system YscQ/HrcQ family protein
MPRAAVCRPLQAAELPQLSAAAAATHRWLLRSAHPALRFGPLPTASPASPPGPGWWLQLQLGAVPLVLQASAAVWPEWSPAQTGSAVPEALVSAGIAHAAAPLWSALAQATGAPVQLLRACWLPRSPTPPTQALAWQLGTGEWRGSVHAPTASAWAAWAAALPAAERPALQQAEAWRSGALGAALPITVALELGRTRLPAADLGRARRHAVLLIDALHGTPPMPIAGGRSGLPHTVHVLAGRQRWRLAQALWQPPGRWLRQALSTVAPASSPVSLEGTPMSAQADRSPAHAAPAADEPAAERLDLGPIEIEVRFELARQHWPLAELAQWRIGESLPFDVSLVGATVGAWVHEHCVASGRLVVVGDRLGLRIDALHAQPSEPGQRDSGGSSD